MRKTPLFCTTGTITEPTAKETTGYVAPNSLPAPSANYFFNTVTQASLEVCNFIEFMGGTASASDTTQLLTYLKLLNQVPVTVSTGTVFSQFTQSTVIKSTITTSSQTLDIKAGAAAIGTMLTLAHVGTSSITLITKSGSTSATLYTGVYRFVWDGTNWCGMGRMNIRFNYAAGSSTFVVPWTGSYEFEGCSGGGSGGGISANATLSVALATGGSGGGYIRMILNLVAGQSIYLSVGAGGSASSAGANNGNAGGVTTIGTSSGGTEIVSIPGGLAGTGASASASTRTISSAGTSVDVTWGASAPNSTMRTSAIGQDAAIGYASLSGTPVSTETVLMSMGGMSPIYKTQQPYSLLRIPGSTSFAGLANNGPGAGGGGAAANSVTITRAGAAGNDGALYITA
jgi:hypothetical protein